MQIEPLESRIAPAGIVSITATGADIRITGDGEANVFSVTGIDFPETILRVTATSGTSLRFGDQTASTVDIPLGKRKNLVIDLGAGADSLSLTDIQLPGKVDIKGGAGNNTLNLSGIMEEEGIFSYSGGDDDDTIIGDVISFGAAGVRFDMKNGTNFMDYTDDACMDRVVGSVTILGGNGDDTVNMRSAQSNMGPFSASLGNGNNSLIKHARDITIGSFTYTGGTGTDELSVTASHNITITKGFTATVGDKEASVELGAVNNLVVRGALNAKFGTSPTNPTDTASFKLGGRDVRVGTASLSFDFSSFAECIVGLGAYVDGTGVDDSTPARNFRAASLAIQGASKAMLNVADSLTVKGNLGIATAQSGAAPATNGAEIVSRLISIGGSLKVGLGDGVGNFRMAGDAIDIAGSLAIGMGEGDYTTEVGLPDGSLSAASVAIVNRTETVGANETIAFTGRIETTGAVTIASGEGDADIQFNDADLDIGKNLAIKLGGGTSNVTLDGESLSVGTTLTITALKPDELSEDISLNFANVQVPVMSVLAGAAQSAFSFQAQDGRVGTLNVDLGAGANRATIDSTGTFRIGKLSHKSKSESNAARDRLAISGVQVRELLADFGAADSVLAIADCRIGKLGATMGAGADLARFDDTVFVGDVGVATGLDADDIEVENDETHWAGQSRFQGRTVFDLGGGNDDVIIAKANTSTQAFFYRAVLADGGEGTDTFTPHATNASFAVTPSLTSFP